MLAALPGLWARQLPNLEVCVACDTGGSGGGGAPRWSVRRRELLADRANKIMAGAETSHRLASRQIQNVGTNRWFWYFARGFARDGGVGDALTPSSRDGETELAPSETVASVVAPL